MRPYITPHIVKGSNRRVFHSFFVPSIALIFTNGIHVVFIFCYYASFFFSKRIAHHGFGTAILCNN